PWPSTSTVERQAMIDVIRFDGQMGGDVRLEARWRILGREKQELVLRYSSLTETTGASGYPALVAAMSRSVAALSREIAEAAKALPGTRADSNSGAGVRRRDEPGSHSRGRVRESRATP